MAAGPVTLLDSQISDVAGHKLPFFNDAQQHLIITNFQVSDGLKER